MGLCFTVFRRRSGARGRPAWGGLAVAASFAAVLAMGAGTLRADEDLGARIAPLFRSVSADTPGVAVLVARDGQRRS